MISIIVLFIVFSLIAIRKIGNISLQIWQIMLFGAITVLLTGQISFANALNSINLDVLLFLFGMFIIGIALEESGYLSHLSYKMFKKAKSMNQLILLILFGMGTLSAVLMNDTVAIIGTPVVLLLARKHSTNAKILLLALAFSVTIGSVMSPIGNPQNLLIAIKGNIENPFLLFFRSLFLPTMINLLLAFFLLKIFYKEDFHKNKLNHTQDPIKDPWLTTLSKISLIFLIFLIFIKIAIVFSGIKFDFRLTYIALISALPILLFSKKRFEIAKKIDWSTLVFFAAMFVLMESVWDSGFFQEIISGLKINITSIAVIILIGVILSQLISNVPLVALYIPMLISANASSKELMALAAGSTIAGNLFILGAASNIIIIQHAEKENAGESITFIEFAKIGVPLTAINVAVYWVFLVYL